MTRKNVSKVFLFQYIVFLPHLLEVSVLSIKIIFEVFLLPPQIFIAFRLEMTYFYFLLISSFSVSMTPLVVMNGGEVNYVEGPRCF